MARQWTAEDYQRVMVCGTTCVCLLLFVIGTFWLVLADKVRANTLGAVSGTGLLGIGGLLLKILQLAIKK